MDKYTNENYWYDDLLDKLNKKNKEVTQKISEAWYFDPERGRIYYLANPVAVTIPTFPVPAYNTLTKRRIETTDFWSHEIENYGADGKTVIAKYWYLVFHGVPSEEKQKYSSKEIAEAYPKHPNMKTLDEFVKKYAQSSQAVDFRDGNRVSLCLQLGPNQPFFTLMSQSHTVIRWEENIVTFYTPGGNSKWLVDLFKTYVGQSCQFELRDGLWGYIPPKGDWAPLYNGSHFQIDGDNPLSKQDKLILQKEKWSKELVANYIDNITFDTIIQAFADMTADNTIVFRCGGCQAWDSSHMTMHVERGDVTPYLILNAFKQFGNADPEKLLWKSVDFIRKYKDEAMLDELKKNLKAFLLDCILHKGLLLREHPTYGEYAQNWQPNRWRHSRYPKDGDDMAFAASPEPTTAPSAGGWGLGEIVGEWSNPPKYKSTPFKELKKPIGWKLSMPETQTTPWKDESEMLLHEEQLAQKAKEDWIFSEAEVKKLMSEDEYDGHESDEKI